MNILARTISIPTPRGKSGVLWQYHSRSDHHSKVACWAILFDLLTECRLLKKHVAEGRVVFGINQRLADFRTHRRKNLDLVLATPAAKSTKRPKTFKGLAAKYGIQLTPQELRMLADLPELIENPVDTVELAIEAKACMTEHGKAGPRLHDELTSSHDVIHGAFPTAIAAGFAMINLAREFVSPGRNLSWRDSPHVTQHDQPRAALATMAKVHEIPRRTNTEGFGFDALGIVLVDSRNDGSPVRIVEDDPAPQPGDPSHYDAFISRLSRLYESRFPHL